MVIEIMGANPYVELTLNTRYDMCPWYAEENGIYLK